VLAGWVLATDLRQYDRDGSQEPAPTPPTPIAVPSPQPTAVPGSSAPPESLPTAGPSQTSGRQIQVTALPPLPITDLTPPVVSITRAVTVSLRMSTVAPPSKTPIPGQKTTPIPSTPVVGLRIQLVNAFGDLLAEAIAPASGEVVLTREITPETALFVRLPALGLLTPVTGPQVTITVPEVRWQP